MISNHGSIGRWAKVSPWWVGYAVTLIAELALTAVLHLLLPIFPLANFPIPYVLIIMMVLYFFGEGPAILAFFLGLICFLYAFPPYHTIWPPATTAAEWAGLVALLMGTSIVGFAVNAMQKSKSRAEMLAAELQKTNECIRETLVSIAACFFALDSEWRFLDINRVAENIIFGRPAKELLGKSFLQEYPQVVDSEFYRQCQHAIKAQCEVHFEDWFESAGRWFECHVFPRNIGLEIYLRDITKRKYAEEAVRQSEEKFRNLVENTNDWFWEMDVNCIYTYVSPRVRDLLGYEPEEVIGKRPFDFMPENEATDICDTFTAVLNERKPLTLLESNLVHKDGHLVVVEISGVPIVDELGILKGYRGVDREITERKLAEIALRESESRYRSLIETMNEGFATSDENYVFTYVNLRFADLLGYSPNEIVGHKMEEFLEENSREIIREQSAERRVGRHDNYEIVWTAKDGHKVYTLISPKPVFGGDGKFNGSFATLTDITDRKQMEESLRESEQIFRQLFHNANDAIFLYEMGQNNMPGKFIEVNDVTCKRLGYSRSELLTMGLLNIDAPEVLDRIPGIAKEILERGHNTFEIAHIGKSGLRIPVEVNSHLFEMDGKKVVLSIARDITERKRAEEERRAFEKCLEEQKRQFYRETIFSVTGGKLDICDEDYIIPYRLSAEISIEVLTAPQASDARHHVEMFCRAHGFVDERLDLFILGVGEAITNAVKHGTQGIVYAGLRGEVLWVGVQDNGPGIESLILPRAVLLQGFSTKPSLGLGYSVMLDVADRIHLKTDEHGTFVILEKALTEHSVELSLHDLPDTWGSIPG